MPQNLIQLPKEATIHIAGNHIQIEEHRVRDGYGLIGCMMIIVMDSPHNREILTQFEKYRVSFEAAIEESVRELEGDAEILANILDLDQDIQREFPGAKSHMNIFIPFSKSEAGRTIAGIYVEKIRNCSDWGELYDQMHWKSKFHREMKTRTKMEMKQQCRKV